MIWDPATRSLSAPVCLTWQLTDRCNLRCLYCLSGGGEHPAKELSLAEAKDFLDDLAEMKVFYINLGGGEPLLHPHFYEIVDYAYKKDIYVQFSTNGTLLDSRTAGEIAGRGLRVQVSLDGWESSVNDHIRGRGTYHSAVEALRYLREKNVMVTVNCVVTRFNAGGLDQMLQLAASYGAGLRLSRLRPSGRARDLWRDMVPDVGQYRALYHWLLSHPEVKTGDSFFFLSPYGKPLPGLSCCGAGKLTCSVDPQGYVYPCPFTMDPGMIIGNVRIKPLSRLWLEVGEFSEPWHSVPKACKSCPGYSRCRGGCRGASYLVYGRTDMPDPECIRGEISG